MLLTAHKQMETPINMLLLLLLNGEVHRVKNLYDLHQIFQMTNFSKVIPYVLETRSEQLDR